MEEVQARVGLAPVGSHVEIEETSVSIQFLSDRRLEVDGRSFSLDVATVEDLALYSVLLDGASYEVVVDEREGNYYALVRGKVYRVKATDASDRRASRRASEAPVGPCVIRAPLCGLVVEVTAATGQAVQADQVLVVLESMKMENEVLSPRAGVVKELRVRPGSVVREGDVLSIVI